jgi:N-acetylglucosaminyldiphosphoundecaprenol N-acetyl-beta-D-mannosaminyltransferase
MEAQDDRGFLQILNRSDLNVPDGMPLAWLGRLSGLRDMDRVFGPDLMLEVFRQTAGTGIRHFFYGGNEGIAQQLAEAMVARFPGSIVVGVYCPPFRPLTIEERADVLHKVGSSKADIVWVGMSTPKQERWMSEVITEMPAKVVLGVGAAFDYNTGKIQRAPVWMQRTALEWLYRLLQEPRRLYRRYLRNNPRFIALIVLERLGLRKSSATT